MEDCSEDVFENTDFVESKRGCGHTAISEPGSDATLIDSRLLDSCDTDTNRVLNIPCCDENNDIATLHGGVTMDGDLQGQFCRCSVGNFFLLIAFIAYLSIS